MFTRLGTIRLTFIKVEVRDFFPCRKCSSAQEGPERNQAVGRQMHKYDRLRKFVDWTFCKVKGGDGGNGSDSFRKTRRINAGGPDGGDGGKGGDVLVAVDPNLKQLRHIKVHYNAQNGGKGQGNKCSGKRGTDLVIKVPPGTVVRERFSRELISTLETMDQRLIIARGGQGGLGNVHFATPVNRAPMETTPGEPGEEKQVELELKIIADVGLVGYPNAGKSTLLRALSRALPAVAAYPFTTLRPHIGVVEYLDFSQILVADIPGLVDGAHLNRGLGHSFLRHIERCKCLLYVLDLSADSPTKQLDCLKRELNLYQEGLADLPSAIIGNKIDLVRDKKTVVRELLHQSKTPVIPTSGKFKVNIDAVKEKIYSLCTPAGHQKESLSLYKRR